VGRLVVKGTMYRDSVSMQSPKPRGLKRWSKIRDVILIIHKGAVDILSIQVQWSGRMLKLVLDPPTHTQLQPGESYL
jgi:hypothetical protein